MMGKKFSIIILVVFLVGGISLVLFSHKLHQLMTRPLLIKTTEPVIIYIDKKTSASGLGYSLKSKHLIHSTRLFLLYIRFKGISHRLQAGIYQVMPGESISLFLNRVVAGDVLSKSFKIIEGTTLNQVQFNLKNAPFLTYAPEDWKVVSYMNNVNPEGLLLADTYNYQAGSDAKQLLRLANKNLLGYLDDAWLNRNAGLPYKSAYELLIAASIIEREAFLAQEKEIIASVLVNRLNKNMPLQMDPTVIYALGTAYQGKLTHKDLAIESPYNTYRYRGLPPTPIAMVGKEAIKAAAHPQKTNYLYFVARGDGSHCFSRNYEEQKRAIKRYKEAL